MKFLKSLKEKYSNSTIAQEKMQVLKGGDDKRKGVSRGGSGVVSGTNGNKNSF